MYEILDFRMLFPSVEGNNNGIKIILLCNTLSDMSGLPCVVGVEDFASLSQLAE